MLDDLSNDFGKLYGFYKKIKKIRFGGLIQI